MARRVLNSHRSIPPPPATRVSVAARTGYRNAISVPGSARSEGGLRQGRAVGLEANLPQPGRLVPSSCPPIVGGLAGRAGPGTDAYPIAETAPRAEHLNEGHHRV